MSSHYDVVSLEREVADKVKKNEYTVDSVFGAWPTAQKRAAGAPSVNSQESVQNGRTREPNRQHTTSLEAQARRMWRPKSEGDFTVEVKKTRTIQRPVAPTSRGPGF